MGLLMISFHPEAGQPQVADSIPPTFTFLFSPPLFSQATLSPPTQSLWSNLIQEGSQQGAGAFLFYSQGSVGGCVKTPHGVTDSK